MCFCNVIHIFVIGTYATGCMRKLAAEAFDTLGSRHCDKLQSYFDFWTLATWSSATGLVSTNRAVSLRLDDSCDEDIYDLALVWTSL